jgi:hypothetical protein
MSFAATFLYGRARILSSIFITIVDLSHLDRLWLENARHLSRISISCRQFSNTLCAEQVYQSNIAFTFHIQILVRQGG